MYTKNRITGKKALDIFENFQTDPNLTKFKDTEKKQFVVTSSITWNSTVLVGQVEAKTPNKTWLQTLLSYFNKPKNVTKVFDQIFENLDQVKEFQEREADVESSLEVAEKNGQTALAEKIKLFRHVHRLESQLVALQFVKVITEEQLIEFADGCEFGLRLDWIKNFTRYIPSDVIEKKQKADALQLFDNYVILHYDPDNNFNQLTESEIEKKKDPILFGVFRDSRKLYYIGDWVDELCDLTFSDLVDRIGKDNLELKKQFSC